MKENCKSFGTPQTMTAGLTLQQLTLMGHILLLEASKDFLKISENIFEKTLQVRKNIVQTYSSVLLARENIDFLEKNKNNLEKNLLD